MTNIFNTHDTLRYTEVEVLEKEAMRYKLKYTLRYIVTGGPKNTRTKHLF